MPPPTRLNPLDWARRRSNKLNPGNPRRRQCLVEPLPCRHRELHRRDFVRAAEYNICQPHRRRVRRALPAWQLFGHECVVVVSDGAAYRVVRWHTGLNNYQSAFWSAPRPTCDLARELKCALRRAKVRKINSDVRVDHAHQSDIRKIEPFRNHLCTEQHIDLTMFDAVE